MQNSKFIVIALSLILFSSSFPLHDVYATDGSSITRAMVTTSENGLNSLEHDTTYTSRNSLVQVDSDTYALAYMGDGNDGYISTFTISADGTTVTEVATLEHDTANGDDNSLVQVDSDTYALAYTGDGTDGYISTFTIPADGSSITEVATLEHETTLGFDNSLVKVDSDTYALAYAGDGVDGFITTFTIPADGSSITKVATLEHDTANGEDNSLVQVDSDTYALAYEGDGDDGYISTFTISADGTTVTEVATLEHDTTIGWSNSLVKVDSDTYTLAYAGDGVDGFITTFTIPADGSSITEVATLEHDTVYGQDNSLIQVDSDTYALAYTGPDSDGFITTFTIPATGSTITRAMATTSLEHDTSRGQQNSLVQVDSDTYALAYTGDDMHGFITTFTIPADGTAVTKVATLEHDTTNGQDNSLVQVDSDTYALAYSGDGYDGFITTFTIPADGSSITEVATLEHDTIRGQDNSLVQVDSDTYALAYTGDGADGFISTFTISADGTTITEVATLEHDTSVGQDHSLVQVDSDTYALAYTGDGSDGFISTFTIPADGSSITEVATLEHDTTLAWMNSLVKIDSNTYALAYADDDTDGIITTFTIPADGSSITEVATLEHDKIKGRDNSLVQVDSDTYALAYSGDGSDGFISTFTIPADGSSITEVATFEHDTNENYDNSLIQVDSDTYALAYYGEDADGYITTFTISGTATTSAGAHGCHDCISPKLQQTQIQIASDEKIIVNGASPLHITANVGDKITILLNVTDNKPVDTLRFAGLYTNYQDRPSDMNLFYANNFDHLKQVSTSFYEWNLRADDVAYDYDATLSWSDNSPTVVIGETTKDNSFMKNDFNTIEYFMMPFTFTINDSMETTQIIVKIFDDSYNRLDVTLPVTLEIIPKEIVVFSDAEEMATLDKGDVIVTPSEDKIPLLNEPVLLTVLSQWSGYSQTISDDAEMLSAIGLQGESLPAWTKNLGEWVIQEKLDVAELITAIQYVNNQ